MYVPDGHVRRKEPKRKGESETIEKNVHHY